MSRKTTAILLAVLAVSVLSTSGLLLQALGLPLSVGPSGTGISPIKPSPPQIAVNSILDASYIIAPISWSFLCGLWVWRGRIRAKWNSSGFTQDSFDLLVKMKGGPTRLKLLDALSTPKDRSKLAQELGMDWKAVDRHVQLLMRYNFIKENASFGAIKIFTLTPDGEKLLQLIKEMSEFDAQAKFQDVQSASETNRN
jgi:DNA-binding MarR family transcriptional regulator